MISYHSIGEQLGLSNPTPNRNPVAFRRFGIRPVSLSKSKTPSEIVRRIPNRMFVTAGPARAEETATSDAASTSERLRIMTSFYFQTCPGADPRDRLIRAGRRPGRLPGLGRPPDSSRSRQAANGRKRQFSLVYESKDSSSGHVTLVEPLQHEGLLLRGRRLASEEPFLERLGTHNLTGRFDYLHAQRSTDVAPGQLVNDCHGTSASDLECLDNGEFVAHLLLPVVRAASTASAFIFLDSRRSQLSARGRMPTILSRSTCRGL